MEAWLRCRSTGGKVVWGSLFGALLLYLTCIDPLLCRIFTESGPRDFAQEWLSARNYFSGISIYTNQLETLPLHLGQHYHPSRDIVLEWNAHPPASVLVSLPLAALNYSSALLLWNLLSLAALVASIYLLARELRLRLTAWACLPIATLILLATYMGPLRAQLEQGQWNLILVLLLTGTWTTSRAQRYGLAGVLLGLATALKLFPGLLIVVFLLQRRWRLVACATAVVLGMNLLTVLVFGLETYHSYLFTVMPHLERFRSFGSGISLKMFWCRLLNPADGDRVTPFLHAPQLAGSFFALSSLLLLAGLTLLSWVARSRKDRDGVFALGLVTMVLVSPVAWDHYILLLLPAVLILGVNLPLIGLARWGYRLLIGCLHLHPHVYLALFVCDPRQDLTRIHLSSWQALGVLSLYTYFLLALFGFILAYFGSRMINRHGAVPFVVPPEEIVSLSWTLRHRFCSLHRTFEFGKEGNVIGQDG